ncbi:hypothetical protein LEN26_010003 [Aphanomyces euteiches]|nr:hypothetical protein LEN26_012943 [Aphanomyces euteiches]KAH9123051.1 hypothetical protein LEN26_010032 [Aphanomyces euteiches]KAH9123158.1 hypothetical protein LEN26_010003 [Aphanomyces euteiches]
MAVNTKVMEKVTLSNGYDVWYARYGAVDALHTYFLVHGGAGSHEDFNELSPLLVRDNFNVIAIDLPGSGLSDAEAAGGDRLTEETLIQTTMEVIRLLEAQNPRRRFIFVGHSFGGGTLMQAAARGKYQSLVGLALLNSSGFQPHNVTRPYGPKYVMCQLLFTSPVARFFLSYILYFVSIYIIGLSPKLTRKDTLKTCAEYVRAAKLPVFHATAKNDLIVEKAISDEISAFLQPGVKIEYERGDHNIQRTRAAELAKAMTEWATSITKSQA